VAASRSTDPIVAEIFFENETARISVDRNVVVAAW
jgi:hypothetical protein